ncbi:hypothetical protein NE237_023026 [Protea cynaroides]|uniref:Uncharacterized protein n=1 Tax=Protea cynaroides TaxID=273540 RepID=A0A9Q0HFJ3_9MAGN|nr:hypothetical protein NE237_023026 [Protea cynaroides]
MGTCLSCRSLPSFEAIRVVHMNGFVEDFDDSVMVSELTGKPPKYLVCTPTQLVSFSSSQVLPPDTLLQRGHLYFILPFSFLQWEASPIDFVCLATRLTKVAKHYDYKSRHQESSSVHTKSVEQKSVVEMDRDKMSCKGQSWNPILDTINERSFDRRYELDDSDILSSPI